MFSKTKTVKMKKPRRKRKMFRKKNGTYLFEIPGPPPEVFYSKDNMVKSVKNFAVDHGYVIVIRRSEAEKKIVFKCDR